MIPFLKHNKSTIYGLFLLANPNYFNIGVGKKTIHQVLFILAIPTVHLQFVHNYPYRNHTGIFDPKILKGSPAHFLRIFWIENFLKVD